MAALLPTIQLACERFRDGGIANVVPIRYIQAEKISCLLKFPLIFPLNARKVRCT